MRIKSLTVSLSLQQTKSQHSIYIYISRPVPYWLSLSLSYRNTRAHISSENFVAFTWSVGNK